MSHPCRRRSTAHHVIQFRNGCPRPIVGSNHTPNFRSCGVGGPYASSELSDAKESRFGFSSRMMSTRVLGLRFGDDEPAGLRAGGGGDGIGGCGGGWTSTVKFCVDDVDLKSFSFDIVGASTSFGAGITTTSSEVEALAATFSISRVDEEDGEPGPI